MPRTILDVSKWQGSIDWDKVKASGLVSGVMIRAMGNSKEGKPSKPYIDPYFARNYAECTRLGIPVGVYGYFKATTKAQADRELALFKQALDGRAFQLPVAVDIEDKLQAALSKSALTDIVAHCLSVVESWGVYAMLYTGLYFGQTNLYIGGAALKPYDVWLEGLPHQEARPRLALRHVAVHPQRKDSRHCHRRRPERGLQGLRGHHPAGRAGAGQGVRPMETILAAVITGGVTLIGVLIANGKTQAVTETKLEELTREVRLHNNFAQRVPVIEEQLKVANHRIADLEEHEYERERN